MGGPRKRSHPHNICELTTSSLIRTTPVPLPPPTPLPMRRTTSCRPCASAARHYQEKATSAPRGRDRVPHNGDALHEYCGACQFADTRRCTYCHQSKLLSTAHRLPLDRLASLLILGPPRATLEICRELALYARSDAHASETNRRPASTSPSGPCATPTSKSGSVYEEVD